MSQPSRMPTPDRAPKCAPTACELVSTPITERHSSAIPRNAFPATMGEYPITLAGVERSAPRIPGTARIAPTLTTGLDGARSTASASAIASATPGPAVAWSAPTNANECVGIWAR